MSFRHSNVSAGGVVSGTIKHATAALPPRVRSDSAARALQFVAPKWELTADPSSPGWKPLLLIPAAWTDLDMNNL